MGSGDRFDPDEPVSCIIHHDTTASDLVANCGEERFKPNGTVVQHVFGSLFPRRVSQKSCSSFNITDQSIQDSKGCYQCYDIFV